jgi:hypothetical protein
MFQFTALLGRETPSKKPKTKPMIAPVEAHPNAYPLIAPTTPKLITDVTQFTEIVIKMIVCYVAAELYPLQKKHRI